MLTPEHGLEQADGRLQVAPGSLDAPLVEPHIPNGEPHAVRVVERQDAGGAPLYFMVCTCGWVSLGSIWADYAPVRCAVDEAIRSGVRNRRTFELAVR